MEEAQHALVGESSRKTLIPAKPPSQYSDPSGEFWKTVPGKGSEPTVGGACESAMFRES
jgi:hypothetical protein